MTARLCLNRPASWWDTGDPGNRKAIALCAVCPGNYRCADDDPEPRGVIRAGIAYNDRGKTVTVCPRCGRLDDATRRTTPHRCLSGSAPAPASDDDHIDDPTEPPVVCDVLVERAVRGEATFAQLSHDERIAAWNLFAARHKGTGPGTTIFANLVRASTHTVLAVAAAARRAADVRVAA